MKIKIKRTAETVPESILAQRERVAEAKQVRSCARTTKKKKTRTILICLYRILLAEQQQSLINACLAAREKEIRELVYLETGENLLDFSTNSTSPHVVEAFKRYMESHKVRWLFFFFFCLM